MNEKKRVELQQKTIQRQSELIEYLKLQNEKLKLELEEKNKIINSVAPLKDELTKEVAEVNMYKREYKNLIDELRKMKEILNQTVYKGRWKLVKFLIK